MLGQGLGLAKLGNKVITVIKHLKSYWNKNTHQWNHENTEWEQI